MSGTTLKIYEIEQEQLRPNPLPPFKAGDTVRVSYKIREGDKERVQVFEGVVIRRHRGGLRSTFTVRKVSYGIGVERIFPVNSPHIERLEVMDLLAVKECTDHRFLPPRYADLGIAELNQRLERLQLLIGPA